MFLFFFFEDRTVIGRERGDSCELNLCTIVFFDHNSLPLPSIASHQSIHTTHVNCLDELAYHPIRSSKYRNSSVGTFHLCS